MPDEVKENEFCVNCSAELKTQEEREDGLCNACNPIEIKKAVGFVQHIRRHIKTLNIDKGSGLVLCKICDRNIDDIHTDEPANNIKLLPAILKEFGRGWHITAYANTEERDEAWTKLLKSHRKEFADEHFSKITTINIKEGTQ